MKICSQCKMEKSLSEFSIDKAKKSGLTCNCKICRNKNYKKWKENNIEYKRQYDKNRSQLLEVKLKNKLNQRAHKKRNPWINSYFMARDRCTNSNNSHYKRYGGRGIEFLLTQQECIELWNRDKGWLLNHHSIDRIDNDGNYEYDNCRFIEMKENRKKGSKSLYEIKSQ